MIRGKERAEEQEQADDATEFKAAPFFLCASKLRKTNPNDFEAGQQKGVRHSRESARPGIVPQSSAAK